MELVELKVNVPALPVVGSATDAAKMVVVEDQDSYAFADGELKSVKKRWKELDDARKTIVDPINKAKDAVQALFNPVLADLSTAEGVIKRAMITYSDAQENERQRLQAIADEEARKERERLEKKAATAERNGNTERAEALLATAAVVVAAPVAAAVTQIKGTTSTKRWTTEIKDVNALVASILANPAFHSILQDEKVQSAILARCTKLAIAMEGKLPLDGIRVHQESGLSARAA